MFLNMTLGSLLLMGSSGLHAADDTWSGATDDLNLNINWSTYSVPGPSDIAHFADVGDLSPITTAPFSVKGITFDENAQAYNYIYSDSDSYPINIGTSGVVNVSLYDQYIGAESSGAVTFASPTSPSGFVSNGSNVNYPVEYDFYNESSLTFSGATRGNGIVYLADDATFTNEAGDSTIGSLQSDASGTKVVITAGSLTTGSLNYADYASGVISGAGSLIQASTNNSGILHLHNENTYTGGTVINSFGDGGISLESGGSLASTGTLAVNSGTLYLNNSNVQVTGDLSGTVAGLIEFAEDCGININQTSNQTYAGVFTEVTSNTSTLTLGTAASTTATATLQLTGDSSDYAGVVAVNSGNLQVNNKLGAESITVHSGGTLSGTGRFGTVDKTTTIAFGGIMSPGNSVGTVYNAGNQVFSAGSFFNLEQNGQTSFPLTSANLLVVAGNTTINGGTVNITTTNGFYNFNTPLAFIESTGTLTVNTPLVISGGTAGLPDPYNPALYTTGLSYGTNNYSELTQTTFASGVTSVNGDKNAEEVAILLDSIVNPTTAQNTFYNQLVQLTADQLTDVLDDMSGAQYATEVFSAEVSNRQFIRRLYDPLREIVTTEPNCCVPVNSCCEFLGLDVWAEAGGGQRQINGDSGFKLNEWDVTLGLQKTFCSDWTFGIAGSYEHNSSDNGHGSGHTWFGGLYGLYRPACYYVLADIAYGSSEHKSHRNVYVPGVDSLTYDFHATPKVDQVTFYAEAGFDYNFCSFLVQPFVGIEVAGYDRKAFSETDVNLSDLALNINKRNRTSATSSLGVHLTDQFCSGFNISIDLAWLYRFTNDSNVTANFQSITPITDFTVYGPNVGRNSGEGAITFSKDFCDNWRVYVEASGEIWNNASTYNVLGGLQVNW